MALQDLTPQLRTRLSRMERVVGWFVFLALGLLVFGFGYYIYNTAERKGWFKTKAPFFTFTERATGLRVGDPIMLMGLPVGQITELEPMDPELPYNIFIRFELKDPYYGYMWTEGSRARVASADLLGKRVIEVTKGTAGYPIYTFFPLREFTLETARSWTEPGRYKSAADVYDSSGQSVLLPALRTLFPTNLDLLAKAGHQRIEVLDTKDKRKAITGMWDDKGGHYVPFKPGSPYWLVAEESGALAERLEQILAQVEAAVPNILALTNPISRVLTNSAELTSNLNVVALSALPAISNLAAATAQLDRPGAMGEWLIPTNLNRQLEVTLGGANEALISANTNISALVQNLNRSLDNLASITGNLDAQVGANTNMLESISRAVKDADDLVQGLKRHWLLRSAFKTKPPPATNAPATPPGNGRFRSPKEAGR